MSLNQSIPICARNAKTNSEFILPPKEISFPLI